MINQKDDSDKLKEFKIMLDDYNKENKIIYYLLDIINIILKGSIEINEIIFNNFKELKNEEPNNDLEIDNLTQGMDKYINLLFKLILLMIEEKLGTNNNIFENISEGNINLFYRAFKTLLLMILSKKNTKLFKILFSAENKICLDFFYFKLNYSNNEEILLVEKDLIYCCKELIPYHNYPFIFKLIELINANKNNKKIELKEEETPNEELVVISNNNEEKNEENEKNSLILINIVINLIKSIYESLKKYKLDSKDLKDIKSKKEYKHYLRGLINLLITIHNICEMKEISYSKNKTFKNTFIGLVKLINESNLIYSDYCIKIGDLRGKIISELVFDSFLYILMFGNDGEIRELFHNIFIKKNKKEIEFASLFYLMDLLKTPYLEKEKEIKKEIEKYVKDTHSIKIINNLLKTKKNYNLNKSDIIKNLPNYKCISTIKKLNFCIYILGKISIFLYQSNRTKNKDFNNYLSDIFIEVLNKNIMKCKQKFKSSFNEEFGEKAILYQRIKEFYDINNLDNLKELKKLLLEIFPRKILPQYDIKYYCLSYFIWEENESDNSNINKKESNQKTIINTPKIASYIDSNTIFNNDENQQNIINSGNPPDINEIIEKFNKKDKNDLGFLDDIKNKCFIYNPKNLLIKRIFSHVYYNLLFYDNAFMYIKNKYFRGFPEANLNTKQLNYPSKIKNFSNIYEPKLFLRKDFNFYDDRYFRISHDYLYKKDNNRSSKEKVDIKKEKNITSLINSKISSVHFYEHKYKINDIPKEPERILECELITAQYTYFGNIIFGYDYISFETKNRIPKIYDRKLKNDFDLNLFSKYCFSVMNKDNLTNKKKKFILFYDDIKLIIKRRILLMYQALEIFCLNGKSYFLNLFEKTKCDNIYKILHEIRGNLENKDKFEIIDDITEKIKIINNDVKSRAINNYLYLSKINFYSSRTYNDIGQYPIFPWIILDYKKTQNFLEKELDTNQKNKDKNLDPEDEGQTPENKEETNQTLYNEYGIRVFNYPLSMQTEEKRERAMEKFRNEIEDEDSGFVNHHGAHYSNSSYVYFFLLRNYPFSQCMIKLQNYTKENPNRLFISYMDTLKAFKSLPENREIIPDLFCHFDYYSNLNCDFNGFKTINELLVDDLYSNDNDNNNDIDNDIETYSNDSEMYSSFVDKYYSDMYSRYFKFVYLFRKLLNSNLISKYLPKWLDNIFGKNQLPGDIKKREASCNIFSKYTYEEKNNLEKKINKYKNKFIKGEMSKQDLAEKILLRIDFINNFGVTPHKVLDNTIKLKTSTESYNSSNFTLKIEKNIIFIKNKDQILIVFNDAKQQDKKIKKIAEWNLTNIINLINNKNEEFSSKNTLYPCGYIKLLKKINIIDKNKNNHKIPIFKPCYLISSFFLLDKLFIVTCRYLGNIFKIQNKDYYINVLCEDFVTCIVCKESNESNIDDIYIYSGLKNGKLIEWNIKKRVSDYFKKINVREKRNCHCHKGQITCIELYQNQNILITGGEDKMIFIRKIYDFELLTAINLLYTYANPIVGQKINIIPTMVKVSELNCLYVMIYNNETQKSFIRGYNINGLFFAQSEEDDFMNICFTKNGNLLTSYYNKDEIKILNCYDFGFAGAELKKEDFFKNNKSKKLKESLNNSFLVWVDYNCTTREFILLYEDLIVKVIIEDQEKQIKLDFY